MKNYVKQSDTKETELIDYELPTNIEEILLRAEKQIEEGKTIDARIVFKELREKYGF